MEHNKILKVAAVIVIIAIIAIGIYWLGDIKVPPKSSQVNWKCETNESDNISGYCLFENKNDFEAVGCVRLCLVDYNTIVKDELVCSDRISPKASARKNFSFRLGVDTIGTHNYAITYTQPGIP